MQRNNRTSAPHPRTEARARSFTPRPKLRTHTKERKVAQCEGECRDSATHAVKQDKGRLGKNSVSLPQSDVRNATGILRPRTPSHAVPDSSHSCTHGKASHTRKLNCVHFVRLSLIPLSRGSRQSVFRHGRCYLTSNARRDVPIRCDRACRQSPKAPAPRVISPKRTTRPAPAV